MNPVSKVHTAFWGDWTRQKLDILGAYLDAYTTALKRQPFYLHYIDAFAGTGDITIRTSQDSKTKEILKGSARIAYEVKDKKFDTLVFIERDQGKADVLRAIAPNSRRIVVKNGEANQELRRICNPGHRSLMEKTKRRQSKW